MQTLFGAAVIDDPKWPVVDHWKQRRETKDPTGWTHLTAQLHSTLLGHGCFAADAIRRHPLLWLCIHMYSFRREGFCRLKAREKEEKEEEKEEEEEA